MRRVWRCLTGTGDAVTDETVGERAEAAADAFMVEWLRYDGRELDIARCAYIIGWLHGLHETYEPTRERMPW